MLNRLRKTRVAQKIKKTKFAQSAYRSQGDWRYPFMCLGWGLARTLYPAITG